MPSVVATFERPATICGRGGSCPMAATERIATAIRDNSTVRVFMQVFLGPREPVPTRFAATDIGPGFNGPPSGPTITQYTLNNAVDTSASTLHGGDCGWHLRTDRDGGIGSVRTRRLLRFRRQPHRHTQDFDGRFHYCRVVYRQALDGSGGSWRTDYPRGDINFSIRFSELTKANVSFNDRREPKHLLVNLGGPEMFSCPVVFMSAPGAASIDDKEAPISAPTCSRAGFCGLMILGFVPVGPLGGPDSTRAAGERISDLRHPEDHPIFRRNSR
jgi:hypothetical protein